MIFAPLSLCFLTAAVSFFKSGRDVVTLAYGVINPLLVALPRAAYHLLPALRARVTFSWVRRLEALSFWLILLNAPGSLFLHDLGIQYDRFLHVSAAAVVTVILAVILMPIGQAKKAGAAACIGVFLWEGIQYGIDRTFGTRLFFDVAQTVMRDASEDILFGFLGIALGIAYLKTFCKIIF